MDRLAHGPNASGMPDSQARKSGIFFILVETILSDSTKIRSEMTKIVSYDGQFLAYAFYRKIFDSST